MKFGVAMFMTDYSISPVALGRAVEERGLESLWARSTVTFRCRGCRLGPAVVSFPNSTMT